MNGTNFVAGNRTGQVTLPATPQLKVPVAAPYSSAWFLAACFVPAGAISSLTTNAVPLQDMLVIIKEPSDSLVTSWFQYNVQELRFTQPQHATCYNLPCRSDFQTGAPGDIVVLQKDNCEGVHLVNAASYTIGSTNSDKIVLHQAGGITEGDEKGGVADVIPLAEGKVNQMGAGIYKICYATKNSEGESQRDFKMLARTLEILPPPATKPLLTVPRTVMLGQDVVVHWASNNGLQNVKSNPNSWIGLFKAGDCTTDDTQRSRHQCFKAYQFIEANVLSGTVTFSQTKDYKVAGDYDVRFFDGSSRNGQGSVCRGLSNTPHQTYVDCGLEPEVTSSSIHIHGPDLRNIEDMEAQPGMEVVFGGNRGRFN